MYVRACVCVHVRTCVCVCPCVFSDVFWGVTLPGVTLPANLLFALSACFQTCVGASFKGPGTAPTGQPLRTSPCLSVGVCPGLPAWFVCVCVFVGVVCVCVCLCVCCRVCVVCVCLCVCLCVFVCVKCLSVCV